jgi:hypothetical protein
LSPTCEGETKETEQQKDTKAEKRNRNKKVENRANFVISSGNFRILVHYHNLHNHHLLHQPTVFGVKKRCKKTFTSVRAVV